MEAASNDASGIAWADQIELQPAVDATNGADAEAAEQDWDAAEASEEQRDTAIVDTFELDPDAKVPAADVIEQAAAGAPEAAELPADSLIGGEAAGPADDSGIGHLEAPPYAGEACAQPEELQPAYEAAPPNLASDTSSTAAAAAPGGSTDDVTELSGGVELDHVDAVDFDAPERDADAHVDDTGSPRQDDSDSSWDF